MEEVVEVTGVLSVDLGMTVAGSTAGSEDAEALDTGLVANMTSTLLSSSALASESEWEEVGMLVEWGGGMEVVALSISESTVVAGGRGDREDSVLMLLWSDVGIVEEGVAVVGEEVGLGWRSLRVTGFTSIGKATGDASVDSREIGRGTKELGLTGQVSNAVERDWGAPVDGPDEGSPGEVALGGGGGETVTAVGGGEGWDEDDEGGGREWRRTRAVADLMGLWERGAKGLAVRGRSGVGDDDDDCSLDSLRWQRSRRDWGFVRQPRLDFMLVNGTETTVWAGTDCDPTDWTVCISVRIRIVWQWDPDSGDSMEGEVGMEGDDADASEEGGGRGAASDAGEGEECGDMTFVGGRVMVQAGGSMGGEGIGEKGGTVVGEREGQVIMWATLDIADTSHLRLKG
jgi:hypothetical protein